jgi:hypothetical protein
MGITNSVKKEMSVTAAALSFASSSIYKQSLSKMKGYQMAKKSKRRAWTKADVRTLKALAKKENTGVKYRSDFKADRRRNPAESVYYGIVAGLAINVSRLPNLLPVCRSVA